LPWAIVLLLFIFWRSAWPGRQLSDDQISAYLHDERAPQHIQDALMQLGERMAQKDSSAQQFYPDVVRLSSSRLEEIRKIDATIMGEDTTRPEFHQALLDMLKDPSSAVRVNAALALARSGDEAGHAELLRMLSPVKVTSPQAGRVVHAAPAGTAISKGDLLVQIEAEGKTLDVRSPISGRVRSLTAQKDAQVAGGAGVAVVEPEAQQISEALRGLDLIGGKADLPAVRAYLDPATDVPERVRRQASIAEGAILQRAGRQPRN
jgi:biotin carboxyl carrier protein